MKPPILRFKTWEKQAEFLHWLRSLEGSDEDGVVEKSRDEGASFLCVIYAVHAWLFREGVTIGFGSRKEEYVDKLGDPKTIFEKIRFILYKLPAWLLPEGFDERKHDNHMRLINPTNGSAITGESGDGIGRGGRTTMYFIDESAFIERPHLMERSLSQNTRVRVDVSTPNGPGTVFAQKCLGGMVKRFVLDWKDDPRKNAKVTLPDGRIIYPWYETQKAKYDPVTVAQEIDHDHSASVEGICIPAAWVRASVGYVFKKEWAITSAGLDVAEMGKDLCVFLPRYGSVAGNPTEWGKTNTTDTSWRAAELAQRHRTPILYYDVTGVGVGVRGTLETANRPLGFEPKAIEFGSSPTEAVWPDGRTSREIFQNLRAELWWNLRCRFEKTFEVVEEGKHHPEEDMISIPDHPTLISELSMPLTERRENGKIQLESKEKMRVRGVKSPNFADALALAFFPGFVWDGTFGMPKNVKEGASIISEAPRGIFASEWSGPMDTPEEERERW